MFPWFSKGKQKQKQVYKVFPVLNVVICGKYKVLYINHLYSGVHSGPPLFFLLMVPAIMSLDLGIGQLGI